MSKSNLFDFDNIESDFKEKESQEGLKSASTNMLVDFLANSEKLVEEDKRWSYENNQEDEEERLDDDIDNYENNDIDYNNDIKENDIKENDFEKSKEYNQSEYNHHYDEKSNELKSTEEVKTEVQPTEQDIMLIKLDMLRKLGELKQYGVTLSQNYNLNSDLKTMQYEYKLHSDIRSKQNGVAWMSHMMIGIIKGMEMLNDTYNPFDIKLEGLKDKISSDIHNYYDVLGEIYEKYNKPGSKMAPEFRLLLMISGAAISMQVNKVIPSMVPGLSGIINNDNDTLDKLRKKASENSDKQREVIKEKYNNEHNVAAQRVSDLEMIKEKEIEYKKMQDEQKNNTNLKNNLVLSSDSSSMISDKILKKRQNEIEKINKLNKLKQNNETKMLKIQEIENNKRIKEQEQILKKEQEQLDSILNQLNDNEEELSSEDNESESNISEKTSSSSSKTSSSKISINPNIEKIISESEESVKVEKKKKNVKKNKVKNVGIVDGISLEDITLGSKDSGKKKNKTKIKLGS